jgi:hypothetical protein
MRGKNSKPHLLRFPLLLPLSLPFTDNRVRTLLACSTHSNDVQSITASVDTCTHTHTHTQANKHYCSIHTHDATCFPYFKKNYVLLYLCSYTTDGMNTEKHTEARNIAASAHTKMSHSGWARWFTKVKNNTNTNTRCLLTKCSLPHLSCCITKEKKLNMGSSRLVLGTSTTVVQGFRVDHQVVHKHWELIG